MVCYNDEVAYVLSGLCEKRGIAIPDQLSVEMCIRDRIVAVQSEELKKFRKRLASRHSSKNVEGGVA